MLHRLNNFRLTNSLQRNSVLLNIKVDAVGPSLDVMLLFKHVDIWALLHRYVTYSFVFIATWISFNVLLLSVLLIV